MPPWVSFLLWSFTSPAAFACDGARLEQAKADLSRAPNPDLQRRKLVGALQEACTFAPRISDMMKLVPSASAAELPRLEERAAREEPAAWESACPAGVTALDAATKSTGAARAVALFGPCAVERFKFATSEELARADGFVLLSLLVAKHFEEQRVTDFVALPMLRALAGLGAQAAAPTGDDVWAGARAAADAVARTAWNGLSEADWRAKADDLSLRCDTLRSRPVTERQKNRAIEFDTCAQAGRATENANAPEEAPRYRELGGQLVNWGYAAAAALAVGDGSLVANLPDETLRESLSWYVSQQKSGAMPLP